MTETAIQVCAQHGEHRQMLPQHEQRRFAELGREIARIVDHSPRLRRECFDALCTGIGDPELRRRVQILLRRAGVFGPMATRASSRHWLRDTLRENLPDKVMRRRLHRLLRRAGVFGPIFKEPR